MEEYSGYFFLFPFRPSKVRCWILSGFQNSNLYRNLSADRILSKLIRVY